MRRGQGVGRVRRLVGVRFAQYIDDGADMARLIPQPECGNARESGAMDLVTRDLVGESPEEDRDSESDETDLDRANPQG